MNHKEAQMRAEVRAFRSAMRIAMSKDGEARRNVDKISGVIEPSDKPDILVRNGDGRIVGIEHFRVDQCISHGAKKESKAAELSGNAEKFRLRHKDAVMNGDLSEEVYQGIGEIISDSIRLGSNSCVDDIAESLYAGLFGDGNRGHVPKLDAYRQNISGLNEANSVSLGFLIEFHTDLEKWFLNEGEQTRKIAHGQFPLSHEVYNHLQRASEKVDWLILSFCPLYTCEPVDAAVVDCRNGKFRESMRMQGLSGIRYLGLGKSKPYRRQKNQGNAEFILDGDNVLYSIENTSEAADPHEMLANAIKGAAEALELRRKGQSLALSLPVLLCCHLVQDSVKGRKGPITPQLVFNSIVDMRPSDKAARFESFEARWGIRQSIAGCESS